MCMCHQYISMSTPISFQKGVLSQELDDWLANKLPPNHNYTAYIASRY